MSNSEEFMVQDLLRSGLKPNAMRARPVGASELQQCKLSSNAEGYVMPYWTFDNKSIPFYRIRLSNGGGGSNGDAKVFEPGNKKTKKGGKYRQPSDTPTHLYFPLGFSATLNNLLESGSTPYVIITEGEKKSTTAVVAGYPCVGLGGISNWRNRTLYLPSDTKLFEDKNSDRLVAKLPPSNGGGGGNGVGSASAITQAEHLSTLCVGIQPLLDIIRKHDLTVIIIYDSDMCGGISNDWPIKPQVQREAAMLGYQLRYLGIPYERIKQLILPHPNPTSASGEAVNGPPSSIGLDDYLLLLADEYPQLVSSGGKRKSGGGGRVRDFDELLEEVLAADSRFPQHPNVREFVNAELAKPLTRKGRQSVALSVLCELDTRGSRLLDENTAEPYYFDATEKVLLSARLLHAQGLPYHELPLGQLLYRTFGLSSGDSSMLKWLVSQFTGEKPLGVVKPLRVCGHHPNRQEFPDCIVHQLSDHQYAVITPNKREPVLIKNNGEDGVLFEQGQTEPINAFELLNRFSTLMSASNPNSTSAPTSVPDAAVDGPPSSYWWEVLQGAQIPERIGENQARLMCLLCYASPWLRRYRGTQLPIEILTGEAGSGKSTLFELRLEILSGRSALRNMPHDIRDWYSSITGTGGLHVTDNVHFRSKDMQQRMSDEICRLITEPDPHVELRRLYTTMNIHRVPINVAFGVTAIEQPFTNTDIVQRSAIFKLSALKDKYDGEWKQNNLDKFGGREGWLAHHFFVLHRFLRAVCKQGLWDPMYTADHRLIHYEQTLVILAEILGMESSWIPETLMAGMTHSLAEADEVLEGLRVFAREWSMFKQDKRFSTKEIVEWAQNSDDFDKQSTLNNTRSLGRYLATHERQVEITTGIVQQGTLMNKRVFVVGDPKKND